MEKASIDEAYLDLTNNVNERIKRILSEKQGNYLSPSKLPGTFVVGSYVVENDNGQSQAKWGFTSSNLHVG